MGCERKGKGRFCSLGHEQLEERRMPFTQRSTFRGTIERSAMHLCFVGGQVETLSDQLAVQVQSSGEAWRR